MKTKLLKKVRERYSVVYYPKGAKANNQTYNTPIMVVYDRKFVIKLMHIIEDGKSFDNYHWFSLASAKIQAQKELVWAIRKDYSKYGPRRIKQKKIKEAEEKIQYEKTQAKLEQEQKQVAEQLWYNNK